MRDRLRWCQEAQARPYRCLSFVVDADALAAELLKRGWNMHPKLCIEPRLIGDTGKNNVFVEVRFGNSARISIGTIGDRSGLGGVPKAR